MSFKTTIQTLFKLKLAVFLTVGLYVSIPYFLIQQINFANITKMPIWKIDELIGFNSDHIWIYNSLYLFVIIVTFRFTNKNKLLNYAAGFALIATISFVIFILFPTEVMRPSIENTSWVYQKFVGLEGPTNAFPSLHVSMVVFTVYSLIRNQRIGRLSVFLFCVWSSAIIYATLSTKQHVFIDIIGGAGLVIITLFLLNLINLKYAKE